MFDLSSDGRFVLYKNGSNEAERVKRSFGRMKDTMVQEDLFRKVADGAEYLYEAVEPRIPSLPLKNKTAGKVASLVLMGLGVYGTANLGQQMYDSFGSEHESVVPSNGDGSILTIPEAEAYLWVNIPDIIKSHHEGDTYKDTDIATKGKVVDIDKTIVKVGYSWGSASSTRFDIDLVDPYGSQGMVSVTNSYIVESIHQDNDKDFFFNTHLIKTEVGDIVEIKGRYMGDHAIDMHEIKNHSYMDRLDGFKESSQEG